MKKMNYVILSLVAGLTVSGNRLNAALSQASTSMIQSIRTDLNQALGKLNVLEKQLGGEDGGTTATSSQAAVVPKSVQNAARRRTTTPMATAVAAGTTAAGKTRRGGFRSAGVSWGGDAQAEQ